MVDVRDATLKFINLAPVTGSQAALDDLFAQALEPFGIDRFDCGRIPSGRRTEYPAFLSGRGMADWEQYYFDQRYCETDPSTAVCGDFSGPYSWSDVKTRVADPSQLRMWRDAHDGGMREGLIIPVLPRRLNEPVVRLTTPEKALDPDWTRLLQCMSILYATFTKVFRDNPTRPQPTDASSTPILTSRELECLHWAVRGKTNPEIAVIIGISPHTVNSHIESAKRKMGVNTRVQAATLAHELGLLSIT
jgi:DNA-binding CsgD family transcriptional regulator